jgi:hypothetical protein
LKVLSVVITYNVSLNVLIHLIKAENKSTSVVIISTLGADDGDFHAFEIQVQSQIHPDRRYIFYSSRCRDDTGVYGAGVSFEEYSAMPSLELVDEGSYNLPERLDYLPFVVIRSVERTVPAIQETDSSAHSEVTDKKVVVRLGMQWRYHQLCHQLLLFDNPV